MGIVDTISRDRIGEKEIDTLLLIIGINVALLLHVSRILVLLVQKKNDAVLTWKGNEVTWVVAIEMKWDVMETSGEKDFLIEWMVGGVATILDVNSSHTMIATDVVREV